MKPQSLLPLLLLAACAAPPGPACPAGAEAALNELLYFGTERPGAPVGPADWDRFLAEEVTPRFPDGLTVWTAYGQWRAQGRIVREDSFVLNIVHPPGAAHEAAIAALVASYKQRFQQDAVLRVRQQACLSLP